MFLSLEMSSGDQRWFRLHASGLFYLMSGCFPARYRSLTGANVMPTLPAGSRPSQPKKLMTDRQRKTKMIDEQLARLRCHRNNIARYRRLLQTHLTDYERDFIERRMTEEQSIFENLTANAVPSTWHLPATPACAA
jgi:hypothetical protein